MNEGIEMTHSCIIYIHGFRSSPQSSKALQLQDWLAKESIEFRCPALDIRPRTAQSQIQTEIDQALAMGLTPRLIGSSLGGFYAAHFMESHPARAAFKACLINPACYPSRDLAGQVGDLPAWHSGEVLVFKESYLEELADMAVGLSSPERYLLVAATGDTLLDWREMVDTFPGAQHHVVEGSDHSLTDFPDHWPSIRSFLLGSSERR